MIHAFHLGTVGDLAFQTECLTGFVLVLTRAARAVCGNGEGAQNAWE